MASPDHTPRPGSSPGIESVPDLDKPPPPGSVLVQCVDYGPDRLETREVSDLAAFLSEPRPEWSRVRWVNVDGLHPFVVELLRKAYAFHTLSAEDVLHTHQRPKVEAFQDHLFVAARMLMRRAAVLVDEQVTFFVFRDMILTFQETHGDVWDPIRRRLRKPESRMRNLDASYLLYALLDALVDHTFPILEQQGAELEELEKVMLENPTPHVQRRLHEIKRELARIRQTVWPMRDVITELQRDETDQISAAVHAYMRDVHDHTMRVIDIVETYREMASGLNDLYMSAVGNRMNEIMKVLTIMASFFIPITFVAGVYGMNFEDIPELRWKYAYAAFWVICLAMVGALALYFHRKGWINPKKD